MTLMCCGHAGGLLTGLLQRPGPHFHDQAGLLGEGNEIAGRDHAELRMMPAHQSFKPHNLFSLQLDNGLVVKFELLLLDRRSQIGLQAPPLPQLLILLRLEEDIGTPAGRFRPIQGEIGILQKLIGIATLAWRQDDADTCPNAHFTPEHVMGLANGAQHTLGQLGGLRFGS